MLTALILQAASNPLDLPIGAPGEVTVDKGIYSTALGKPATAGDIASAARGYKFVLVGETHTSKPHHEAQAAIVQALLDDGRQVVVGLEMFTRDNQRNVAPFSRGWWDDDEFQAESNWKKQWGHPYKNYKPLFDVVRQSHVPLVALNVPRDWVRAVGKSGPSAITADEKKWVPFLDTHNKDHRDLFTALLGGHPMTGTSGENMYAAQVTWDTGMAKTAVDEMAERPGWVMVVCAGSGHVMYGQGIAYRIKQMTGAPSLIVTGIDGTGPTRVSKGIGAFTIEADPPADN